MVETCTLRRGGELHVPRFDTENMRAEYYIPWLERVGFTPNFPKVMSPRMVVDWNESVAFHSLEQWTDASGEQILVKALYGETLGLITQDKRPDPSWYEDYEQLGAAAVFQRAYAFGASEFFDVDPAGDPIHGNSPQGWPGVFYDDIFPEPFTPFEWMRGYPPWGACEMAMTCTIAHPCVAIVGTNQYIKCKESP